MKQVFIGSTLQSLRQGTKAQEERARAKQNANRILTIPSLRSLLPDRVTVDKILSTYFATLETTYRILHAPTFWSAYEQYWDEARENDSDMDATILAVLACTLCTTTHDTPRYNANGSSFRSQAIVWIKACEAWLRRQSNKRRSLASLQVRLLRLLALSTTCLKTKEYYQEVQKQMAFMVSSGLHRDPGILGSRCSAFEAEMRRRLWATIMELELQASIDKGEQLMLTNKREANGMKGISSMLSNLQYDCAAPRNINDSDLHPDMKYLVDSHPHHTFTDTSYLHCSVRSLSLRARLCATANSLQSPPSLSSTLHSEQEIQTALNSLPRWTDPQALMASTLLDVQLRQFLLIIYQPHVLHRSPNFHCFASSSTVYATATALSTAETLINLHYTLNNASIFALTCLRLDYLRAALLIAHIAYYSSSPFTSRIARPTFEATTNAALKLLEERSMRPGRGSHHYWYLSAAISLVQIQFAEADGKGEPEKKKLEREAGDRVCALLYRVMALQQEEGAEGDPAEVILDAGGAGSAGNPNSMQTPASMVEPGFEVDVGQLQGMEGWDAQGTWGLDDFWFLGDSVSGMGAVEGF